MTHPFESSAPVAHQAFGLRFESRLDWLPLRREKNPSHAPDVRVVFGDVPTMLSDAVVRTVRFEAAPGRYLFKTRTVANFLVENGTTITVAPHPGADRWALANLLLGAVTGAVLMQRNVPALHGCGVEIDGSAVAICGPSGAGKSTLAMLLHRQGCRIIDDNIVPLRPTAAGCVVLPGSGFLRLTKETLAILGRPLTGPSFAAPSVVKHVHVLAESDVAAGPLALRRVLMLDRSSPELLTPLGPHDSLLLIERHWFLGHAARGLGRRAAHFSAALHLAGRMRVARLGHPPDLAGDALAAAVLEVLRESPPGV